jgi:hypothetical protein
VEKSWGHWAFRFLLNFRSDHGSEVDIPQEYFKKIKTHVDSIHLYQHPVLVEHDISNIFRGPRLVDQIHPNIDLLLSSEPAILSPFKFLLAYFCAGPIANIFTDWLYALGVFLTNKGLQSSFACPLRRMLRKLDLDPDSPRMIWSFIILTLLLRIKGELRFHRENPSVLKELKVRHRHMAKRAFEIYEIINAGKELDPTPIILSQEKAFADINLPLKVIPLSEEIKKVAVFGASSGAEKALKYLGNRGIKVGFLVDNNPQLWGKNINGYMVYPPSELIYRRGEYDLCVVASQWRDSIVEQLQAMKLRERKDFVRDATFLGKLNR